ncbi:MAG TPA: hypothetical protein VMV18_07695 [bacterium]|nr:hypothetical protein [bacterium]
MTKPRTFAACALLAPLSLAACAPKTATVASAKPAASPAASASPASSAPTPTATPVVLYDNLGSLHHAVTTKSPQAQKFFDQGMRLLYGFNHAEAIRSFNEAARLDPDCAMAYWGAAIALGPNINLPSDAEGETTARALVAKARLLGPKVSAAEREYIEAAVARYAGPPNPQDRHANDEAYADAMREVAKNHPDDPDAQALFAESMLDLRPWQQWNHDGTPAPGTEEIERTLETALKKFPDHPGLNHYYIHTEEGGPHPERARAAAARLPALEPGAGHLVHMPSHIYIHTSQWNDASTANERAIEVDRAYLAGPHAEGAYSMMYVAHNFQFLWATASMEGRSAVALKAARDMTAPFDEKMVRAMEKDMPGVDYTMAPPLIAEVRFGHWAEILKEPAPPADFRYLTAMWHFARAFAFARTGKMEQARDEQLALQQFVFSLKDDEMIGPLNTAKGIFGVGTKLLAGELMAADGKLDDAIALEEEAVAAEDALSYDEPPAWPLPTRHYLGALLLQAKKPSEAVAVYQADLKKNPENGWALFGLEKAWELGRAAEAKGAHERFAKAWAHADVTLTTSRF